MRHRNKNIEAAVLSDISSALHIPTEALHIINLQTISNTSTTRTSRTRRTITTSKGKDDKDEEEDEDEKVGDINVTKNVMTIHYTISPNTIRQYRVDYLLETFPFPLT